MRINQDGVKVSGIFHIMHLQMKYRSETIKPKNEPVLIQVEFETGITDPIVCTTCWQNSSKVLLQIERTNRPGNKICRT